MTPFALFTAVFAHTPQQLSVSYLVFEQPNFNRIPVFKLNPEFDMHLGSKT